jgi:hypothetical protein
MYKLILSNNMRRTLIVSGALAAFFAASIAFAQTASSTPALSVVFPIAELGSCSSKESCKAYCDVAAHQDACLAYAETHGLMKKEDTDKARIVIKATGPGGCKGLACKTYCADTAHEDACLAFAAEHGLLRAAEVSVVQDIKQNGGPGGCTTAAGCREYCADTTHAAECKAFAESHNLKPLPQVIRKVEEHMASSTEAKAAEINALLAKTAGPGGCTTADACRTYCAVAEHQAECAAFAQANGLTAPGARMGSTTPMKPASTTIPAAIRQKIEAHIASSTSGKPGLLRPIVPGKPVPTTGVRPATGASANGSVEAGAPTGGEPQTNTATPEGGAGVLWGVLNFFGLRR